MNRIAFLVALASFGCSSERAQTVTLAAAPSAEPPRPAPSLPPTVAPPAPRNACVMLYECGCNAGCTEIDRPLAELHAGMRAGVASGPLKGARVFVVQSRTGDGDSVLTVQRADPDAPIMCASGARGPLVGYLCGTSDLTAARACTTC